MAFLSTKMTSVLRVARHLPSSDYFPKLMSSIIFREETFHSFGSLVKHLFKQIRHGDTKCSSEFGQCCGRDFFVGITEDISHSRV